MSNWVASTITIFKKSVQIGLLFNPEPPKLLSPNWQSDSHKLKTTWVELAKTHFPLDYRLPEYNVCWSERTQKRVLGSCNLTRRRVLVARALDRPELEWALEALLYHEMCHAVVGIKKSSNGRRNKIHGREFYEIERRHPGIVLLDNWIKSGGWQTAVRSFASHKAFIKRQRVKSRIKK